MIQSIDNGPYLHGLGWTHGPQYVAGLNTGHDWNVTPRTLGFDGHVAPRRIATVSNDQLLEPLPSSVLKASGVARARSAAKSTVFAALLAKTMLGSLKDRAVVDGNRVGVGIVSSSAIIPIFWKFESVGVSDSWDNTDTMLLPASIPSAVGTASSSVTDSHATAITFADGAVGMFSAIEHAHLGFVHDRSDYFLVIAAEEACAPMIDAMQSMGVDREVIDGAAGFVLSRERLSEGDWQVGIVETLSLDEPVSLPSSWADAPRFSVTLNDQFAAYTGCVVPQVISQAIGTDADRVVIEFVMSGRARSVLGLARCETL